jgi:hypothetical protein
MCVCFRWGPTRERRSSGRRRERSPPRTSVTRERRCLLPKTLVQRRSLRRARSRSVQRVSRRSLHTLSVVARFAHLPTRGFERRLRRVCQPAVARTGSSRGRSIVARNPLLHRVVRSSPSPVASGGFANPPWRRPRFTGSFALRPLPTRRGAKSALLSALVLPSLADRAAPRGRRPTVTLRHTVRLTLVYSRART